LSQYSAERLDEAVGTAEANGLTKPSVLQTWYNMVEREKLEGELLQAALKHGLSVVPYYGLANGFLAGKYREKDDLTKSPRGQRSAQYLEGRGMRVLGALDQVAAETGEALATIALAWTSAQPGIAATLASATSVDQLQELMASMTLKLTSDQLALLTRTSS
jgi:aryl-alcohol dehydrogenase-like predicted oxidoreductase